MTLEKLALLRSLAIRPCPNVAASLQPVVAELHQSGHVTRAPEGWMTTAEGCDLIESTRACSAAAAQEDPKRD